MKLASSRDESVNALLLRKTPKMQAFIQELAHEYHFDLTCEDWETNKELLLDLAYMGTLAIERLDEYQVSLGQFVVINRQRFYTPKIIFHTYSRQWVPMATNGSGVPPMSYAITRSKGRVAWCMNPLGQARLASFCEDWARELREAGWLEGALRRE